MSIAPYPRVIKIFKVFLPPKDDLHLQHERAFHLSESGDAYTCFLATPSSTEKTSDGVSVVAKNLS